jgi:DNA modification methylase
MYNLINDSNMNIEVSGKYQLVFADYVYENLDFSWIDKWWTVLVDGGVFIAMTDFHSIFELGMKLKSMPNSKFVNHLVWKNEWGNHPKDRFHQCFDDIVIFSKGSHNHFYSDRIQIPKVTITKGLNPSGRETKTATAFISDICLTTTALERVKYDNGHLVRWQKPIMLIQRLLSPFINLGDNVLDLFMGTGVVGKYCLKNNINYIGIENDPEIFVLAKESMEKYERELSLETSTKNV